MSPEEFAAASDSGQLSTRDRRLMGSGGLGQPDEPAFSSHPLAPGLPLSQGEGLRHELAPANFDHLEQEIASVRDPRVRAMLVQEHKRLKQQAEAFLQNRATNQSFDQSVTVPKFEDRILGVLRQLFDMRKAQNGD